MKPQSGPAQDLVPYGPSERIETGGIPTGNDEGRERGPTMAGSRAHAANGNLACRDAVDGLDHPLDILGEDVHPVEDDDVLDPTSDGETSTGAQKTEVTGFHPAARPYCRGSRLGIPVISSRYTGPAD